MVRRHIPAFRIIVRYQGRKIARLYRPGEDPGPGPLAAEALTPIAGQMIKGAQLCKSATSH